MLTVEPFLKGRDNEIHLTLLENGQPVPNLQLSSRIDIVLGKYLTITRTSPGQGVDYSQGSGKLILTPGRMTEDLSVVPDQMIPAVIVVFDSQNVNGVQFGGADSEPRLMFSVRPSRTTV